MGRRKLTPEEKEARRLRTNAKKKEENRRRRSNPEYVAKELAKSRETRRNWSRERRDKANAICRASHARRSPERIAEQASYMKEYVLKNKYGLTIEGWKKLFEKQEYKCACCEATEPGSVYGWATDHDHTIDKNVRGILCHKCNLRIGQLGDTYDEVFKNTNMYLEYLLKTKIRPN